MLSLMAAMVLAQSPVYTMRGGGKSVTLKPGGEYSVTTTTGWTCSPRMPGMGYGAWEMVCTKGEERAAFTVQCDTNRPKDHVELRLGKKLEDSVYLGCQ